MRLKTILNQSLDIKPFVIGRSQFNEKGKRIDVEISCRANGLAICSICGLKGKLHDTLPTRAFEFIPIWGFPVFLIYAMRRVNCKKCGVKVEKVPWADGKNQMCNVYRKYLADWAKDLSWQAVANRFKSSWQSICRAVQWVVAYGLENQDISNVQAIGVDEVQYHKGHTYMTLVYQIDKGSRRLLWVGKKRTQETLNRFFSDMWNKDRKFRKNIKVVCSDMWKAYLNVIAKKTPDALNVLDKFHIMQKLNKALDEIRSEEAKRLKKEGKKTILKHSRWCFLKRKFNLTRSQKGKLNELVDMNLNIMKAYILKEQFHKFWEYKSPTWAGKFLDNWCELVHDAELEPLNRFTRTLQNHRELILNYFIAGKQYNSGIVEGLNRRVNLTVRKSFGFRSFNIMQTALYHQLGKLDEPEFSHEFW